MRNSLALNVIEGFRNPADDVKIAVQEVNKVYRTKNSATVALEKININVSPNEFVSIVGPSGCGKSTLLRMIAGLDTPTSGEIRLQDKVILGPGADRGMVFQTYTLFPWLNVEENIRFGLDLNKVSKRESAAVVEKYLELIGLSGFRKSYPKELSGGMKQRVAIARALANSPEVLLMDEPFGALDQQTKTSMQEMLLKIWRTEKTTVIFITHDIEEAIFLSQRVYVMSARPGRVVAEIPVNLPKNRTLEVRDTDSFINTRKKIVGLLKH